VPDFDNKINLNRSVSHGPLCEIWLSEKIELGWWGNTHTEGALAGEVENVKAALDTGSHVKKRVHGNHKGIKVSGAIRKSRGEGH